MWAWKASKERRFWIEDGEKILERRSCLESQHKCLRAL